MAVSDLSTNLIFVTGFIIGCVPGSISIVVITSLTIVAKRLSKKYMLVKNIQSIPTLGATSCVVVDKTGILTQDNTTPRNEADIAIMKLRSSGIKVIMVDDDPASSVAFANKVNILMDPTKEYNYLVNDAHMDPDNAFHNSTCIVIHGDTFA